MTNQQLRIVNCLIDMGGEAQSKFELASESGVDFKNVSRDVDKLERGGVVSVERGSRGAKRITLRIRLLV